MHPAFQSSPSPTTHYQSLYLGIDFGTSGARAIVLDQAQSIQTNLNLNYPVNAAQCWSETWQQTLEVLIQQIPSHLRHQLSAVAINGTSATVLFCNQQGTPIAPPLMYNDPIGKSVLATLATIAPPHHITLSPTSSLAKLLWWQGQYSLQEPVYLLHQADWLAFLLHRQLGISDYHNALKLGYDVATLTYPDWFSGLDLQVNLPQVLPPGSTIAEVQLAVADRLGLPRTCVVKTGTTDSIAAFLASGASAPGEAVTSLGSTLVLKLLSEQRVDDARYGLYSHRLGNLWLVGGASNTGGAVLRQFFSDEMLRSLSQQIPHDRPSPLDYYPLLQPGERFPINDPDLPPRLDPRPSNPADFLHGLLESMARIETQGYQHLQALGATPLKQVYTAGGGANNPTWTAIRYRHLQVPLRPPRHTEAAYGTALLAMK